jgi:hypothetical protein
MILIGRFVVGLHILLHKSLHAEFDSDRFFVLFVYFLLPSFPRGSVSSAGRYGGFSNYNTVVVQTLDSQSNWCRRG